MRFCGAMGRFWVYRGHYREGSAWCRGALARSDGSESPDSRVQALLSSGTLAMMQGDVAEACRFHEEALAISRQACYPRGIARSLERLGMLYKRMGRPEEAGQFLESSIGLCRESGDTNLLCVGLVNLGCVELDLGLESARDRFEECLAIARVSGTGTMIALALANLASISLDRGDYEASRLQNEESLALMSEVGDKGGVTVLRHNLAIVAEKQCDLDKAIRLARGALGTGRIWVTRS